MPGDPAGRDGELGADLGQEVRRVAERPDGRCGLSLLVALLIALGMGLLITLSRQRAAAVREPAER
jgi:hypothetical protein